MPTSPSPGMLLLLIDGGVASLEYQSGTNFRFPFCSRLSGEESRQFLPAVEKHFSRLGKATLVSLLHIFDRHKAGGTSEYPIFILKRMISMILNSVHVSCCFQAHVSSPNTELSQAALQALGFCVYHSRVVSGLPGTLLCIFYTSEFQM